MTKHNSIVVFDFETTGLNSNLDEIIELAAISYEKVNNEYVETKRLSSLIKVKLPLPAKIVEITNITDEMIENEGEDFILVLNQFLDLIDDNPLLVGYNISFDLSFLIAAIDKAGIIYPITNDILDVMAVYKDHYKWPHRLDNVVQTFNITHPNTHRATDDVIATKLGLLELSKVVLDINKYVNVIGYNKKYGSRNLGLPQLKYIAQYGGYREIEKS